MYLQTKVFDHSPMSKVLTKNQRHKTIGLKRPCFKSWTNGCAEKKECRETGWTGTVEVNWDTGLEPRDTVSPASSLTIHLHSPNPPRLTVFNLFMVTRANILIYKVQKNKNDTMLDFFWRFGQLANQGRKRGLGPHNIRSRPWYNHTLYIVKILKYLRFHLLLASYNMH